MKCNLSTFSILVLAVVFVHNGFPLCCADVSLRSSRNLQLKSVTKLVLINAQTDEKIIDLFDGMVIYMQDIAGLTSPNFNINATTSGSVSSVKFGYKQNQNFRTDTSTPYSFCGNQKSDFDTCTQLTYGVHSVSARTISNGIMGPTLSLTFTIASGPKVSPVQPPVRQPTKAPAAAPFAAPIPVLTPVFVPVVTTKAPVPVPTPTAAPPSTLPAIHTLRLMYTGVSPSAPVLNLSFDTVNVVDLQALNFLSGKFNIDALVGPGVKSVTFSNGRTETSAPLAYCGNSGDIFYDCDNLLEGANVTVSVTAYPEAGGLGSPILTRSTTIQIIRPLPPVAPTPPTAAPVAAPVIPPVPGCPLPKVCKLEINFTLIAFTYAFINNSHAKSLSLYFKAYW
jgi:hypothetical protein